MEKMMIQSSAIFHNKKWWNTLSTEDLNCYKDLIFRYYRERGYPYFDVDVEYELNKLKRSGNAILDGKIIKQKMAGLSLAWMYHPHAVSVRNGNSLSPIDVFNDDKLFKICIDKRIKYGDNISDAAIRKSLRKYGGLGVSNFRPTSASFIYDYFNSENVWDMCGGYGGRLLGAWLSKSVKLYVTTEPCSETFNGLVKMSKDLQASDKEYEIYKVGSEEFKTSHSFDLCFTSPPYFNQEKYSYEPTQSYIKYPTYNLWIHGYLKLTIQNCYKYLKEDGKLVVNIANTKNAPTLENDFLIVAKDCGFVLMDKLFLELSAREHYSKDKEFKYEPVFVFEKD